MSDSFCNADNNKKIWLRVYPMLSVKPATIKYFGLFGSASAAAIFGEVGCACQV
jgi:hypothetical protein